ncbi:MAG: PAS domain-containing protein [Alistipes sp.]|nr:PAS domain-containing protein [Alistipes sp.]
MTPKDDSIIQSLKARIAQLETENQTLRETCSASSKATENTYDLRRIYGDLILDTLPDMITVHTQEGLIRGLITDESTNHSGIPSAQFTGKHLSEVLPPEAYEAIQQNIDRVTATGKDSVSHHELIAKIQIHYFENHVWPLRGKDQLCMCRDITKTVRAQQAQQQLLERMQRIEEVAKLGYWAYYSDIDKFYAPQVLALLLHTESYAELIDASTLFTRYVHPDDRAQLLEIFYHPAKNLEFRAITSTQQVKYFRLNIFKTTRHNRERIIEGYIQDVTSIVRQFQESHKLHRLNSAILENMPNYLYVKNPNREFRYIYWSKAFEQLLGIPADRILNHTDAEIFPLDAEHFLADDRRLLAGETLSAYEEEFTSLTGMRTVSTIKTLVPIAEEPLPLIMGISWDITERKKGERELIEARNRAEESDRLKTSFLANMSHEIRTPLNAIVGFAKILPEITDPNERDSIIHIIDTNSDQLLMLINDILDLAKIEAGTMQFSDQEVELSLLCQNLHDTLNDRIPKGVQFLYDNPAQSRTILADPGRLSQIIINLITNAAKFTTQGHIRFGYEARPHEIEFFVEDTGIGIPQNQIVSIFDRFTKLNSFVPGTGLGLSICKMILMRRNGSTWVDSEEGKGSTFRFTIPV